MIGIRSNKMKQIKSESREKFDFVERIETANGVRGVFRSRQSGELSVKKIASQSQLENQHKRPLSFHAQKFFGVHHG